MELTVDGRVVAEYVAEPDVGPTDGPRPYLHPVRTLAGTVVTDVLPDDHRWHLGVSVAVQDVNGTNLWGGRTYVRGEGYVGRDDHGRIEQVSATPVDDGNGDGSGFDATLRWADPTSATLLVEERAVRAVAVDERSWLLEFAYTLTNPGDGPVVLGSPATNGRPDGTGYGGFYWRAVADATPEVLGPDGDTDEERLNGSAGAWVAMRGVSGGAPYTLIFTGREGGDRWFVRAAQFPGVGVALAWSQVETYEPGQRRSRHHRVLVVDGALADAEVQRISMSDLVR